MTNLNDAFCDPIPNRVPITANDLSLAGIPPRFWRPALNPFDAYSPPLRWWESRFELSASGTGLLSLSAPSSFVELAALTELLKRLLCDGDRPSLYGSLTSGCKFVRSSDLVRNTYDWDELITTGFVLVSSIGVGFTDRLESFMFDMFRARYEVGAVTFYHVVERPGDKEFLGRVLNIIPEGAYRVFE